MTPFLQRLLTLLARSQPDELARQVQYLKVENQVLRAKLPKRIPPTREERRRLLKFGRPLGSTIQHLISIVHPKRFAR